jgi:Carboxypeptidase regulatory-like domain/TonB-dependent Receptor Plug Domain
MSLSLALAQGTTSRISGVATDSSGAAVADAVITARNDDTGISYTTKTSAAGTYSFDSLQIGRYTVRAEATGFKQFVSTGNVLAIGVPTSIDPKFEVGATTESVQVQGGYDLVQTESSGNFGAIIDNITLTQLPIVATRGRSPLALTQYIPGVVQNNSANAPGGDIVVNGSRDRAFNYVLDGIDDNETSSGGSNTSPSHQNPDMLAEFRVITSNPTAEFGRNSGAQVLMVTRAGTNQFHGNLFEFYQSPFLQANTPAAKAFNPPHARPQFVQHIYGGSLGGPIWRDKAFFFANVELLHALSSSPVTRTVYTAAARNGQFRYVTSPNGALKNGNAAAPINLPTTAPSVDESGNPIRAFTTYDIAANDPFHVGLDAATKAYLALTPLPNNFDVGDGLNTAGYNFTAPANDRQVDTTYKIDYVFNQKNALFGRISTGHQNTFNDVVNAGLQPFPGLPGTVNTFRQPRNMAINYRFSPTKNLTNELVVGFNRFGYAFINPGFATAATQPFTLNNSITNPLNAFIGNNRYLTTLQYVDNLTFVKGAHIIKGGFNLRNGREINHRGSIGALNAIPQVNFSTSNNPVSTTQYNTPVSSSSCASCINSTDLGTLNSAVNDMLGRIGSVTAGYVSKPDLSAFKPAGTINNLDTRWDEYDFYIQDTWHATPNLVIDFGIRDDARLAPKFQGFPSLVPNQEVRYGKPLTSALQFVPGKFMDDRWNNFGPSIGFAWDPFKNGKTSIRGNYRIAYDRINSFSFSSSVFQGLPGLTYQVTNSTVGQDSFGTIPVQGVRAKNWAAPAPTATPQALTTPPAASANSLTVSDPHMQTPTVAQWGLSIQHELLKNTVLTVSYIGNHGTHLYGGYDSNQVDFRSNGFLDAFQAAQNGIDTPLLTQIASGDTRNTTHQTGVAYLKANYASTIQTAPFKTNDVGGLANSLANRLQPTTDPTYPNGKPLVVNANLPATFFKPYPQYLGGLFVLQTRDYSNYNGLQVQIERRFSRGFLITANYTYSRTLDVRSYDPTFTLVATGATQSAAGTPFDYHTPRLNYAPSDLDNTHVLNGYFVYDLPFGHSRMFGANWNRALDGLVGGWRLSGDGYLQSGRPITFYSGYNTFSGSVQTPASCSGTCNAHMGNIHVESSGQTYYFTAAQRAQFFVPDAGAFSNQGRNFFRQNHVWQADTTLSKSFRSFREQNLEFRLEAQNVFNVITYDTFGSQSIQSTSFTRLNPASDGVLNNSPRKVQLSAKYVF